MTVRVDRDTVPEVGDGFFVASFSAFGEFVGTGWWRYEKLSKKWTARCRELLVGLGESFDYRWSAELSNLRTKLTAAKGTGLCTFFIGDQVVCSMLLLIGINERAERDAMHMFASSLQGNIPSSMSEQVGGSFFKMTSIAERPLMVVVSFPNESMSEQDQDIVRELSWHFAAAFFQELRS